MRIADPTEQRDFFWDYYVRTHLAEYRRLDPMWQDWQRVTQRCAAIASDIFRRL